VEPREGSRCRLLESGLRPLRIPTLGGPSNLELKRP
jgi:hypothetical protein